MLIMLIAKKDSDSGFGLTILEYSRIVYYSVLPIPTYSPNGCVPTYSPNGCETETGFRLVKKKDRKYAGM